MSEVNSTLDHSGERMSLARAALQKNPDGVIEAIAREYNVPTLSVMTMLPSGQCVFAPAERFEEIWRDISTWGEVLFVVHTREIVLECTGALPEGSYARGYYNFHGASPVAGHLKAVACTQICFVDRVFHGRRSCSVQFFAHDGEAIFKIFVKRKADRELLSDQVAHFEALIDRYAQETDPDKA